MSTDHRTQVEELMADYRRSQERLADTQRDLASITTTARSGDGRIEVVVGPQGVLRELNLAADVYEKHPPDRLAGSVVELTTEAARQSARRAADMLADVLPAGSDPEALLGASNDAEAPQQHESAPQRESGSRKRLADEDDDAAPDSWLQQGLGKQDEA
ncbi:YbaB/EbfC family nucleoid-associated protein [Parasphingorhabdus pacifica]